VKLLYLIDMRKLQESIGLGLLLGVIHGLVQPVHSVPVVPNFTQGSMTSRTETKTSITEVINSMDYNTGYQYSVTGTNVNTVSGNINLPQTKTTNSIDGVTSTWTGLQIGSQDWKLVNPGAGFQFTETYQGPGLSNQTIIQRETIIESATDTTSIFSQ
tara:strand:+ start:857 stop:1330 length:474 start_codon:yes stop_codon:yes gene_type:complete